MGADQILSDLRTQKKNVVDFDPVWVLRTGTTITMPHTEEKSAAQAPHNTGKCKYGGAGSNTDKCLDRKSQWPQRMLSFASLKMISKKRA